MLSIKRLTVYAAILVIVIIVCVFSALMGFKMTAQNSEPSLETIKLPAHKSILTLNLPFKMAPDENFSVNPEIKYYVRSNVAFWGNNEKINLHVYSVDFRTEILDKDWSPNAENMADVTIIALQKNFGLTNQAHQKRPVIIAGINSLEVNSMYNFKGERYVQRVLHVPAKNSTWSLKAVYLAADNESQQMISQIFHSLAIEITE